MQTTLPVHGGSVRPDKRLLYSRDSGVFQRTRGKDPSAQFHSKITDDGVGLIDGVIVDKVSVSLKFLWSS